MLRCALSGGMDGASTWRCLRLSTTLLLTPASHTQDPNVTDPLNKDAARLLDQDKQRFERLVHRSISSGCAIDGEHFPPCRTEEQIRSR